MRTRDLDGPITIINRFTVKEDAETFLREFQAHSQFLREQQDFDFLVSMQVVGAAPVYVQLGHWRTLRGFLQVVHEDAFTRQVQRLGALVETQADQAVSVARALHADASVGAVNIMLTHAENPDDWRRFEQSFATMSDHFGSLPGFGGSDLLRSTVRPLNYLGVCWWRDTESCEQALCSEEYQDLRIGMAELADIATERTRHVAYQRVLAD